jgi:hypothetical protein
MIDYMIDHFNGIMNLYICALLILLASELFDALSKTRL